MADVIEVEYKAKVDGLRTEFNALVSDAKKGGAAIDSAANSNTQSFQKTGTAISGLRKQLAEIAQAEKDLIALRAKSNDPAKIAQYNKKIQEARLDQKALGDEILKTEAATNKTVKAGSNLVGQFKSVAATLGIAFGVAQIINFSKEAFNLSAKAEGIATAFSKIGGEETLQKLRLATRGATSDLELMQAALRAKNFNISTDLLAKGLELAGKVARTTGQDVTYLTNSFVDGLGRKSIRILDNLQISQVDLQKEIKKTGDFNTAVGNIIDKKLRETGVVIDTTADKVARYGTYWQNFLKGSGDFLVGVADGIGRLFDIFTGKLGLLDASIVNQLQMQKKAFVGVSGAIIDAAKESEVKRLQFLAESSERIVKINENLQKKLSKSEFEGARLALQNERELNNSLRHLNDKAEKELTEDELKELERRAKEKKDLRLKTLEELLNLVQKTEEEAFKASAKTDQEKLNLEIQVAEQAARDARDLAIQTGTERVIADAAYDTIVLNNKKIFGEKQKTLFEKDNKERFDELTKSEQDLLKLRTEAEAARDELEDKERKKRLAKAREEELEKQRIIRGSTQFISDVLSSLSQINSNLAEADIQKVEDKANKEMAIIQQQYDSDIISKDQYEAKKAEINKRAADEEREIKRKTFESNRQISLIQTIISTAQATVAALGTIPYSPANIALAALAAAAGAAQIAVITSQPTPKFEKGGKVKGRRHSAGGTLIEAEVDEFVVKRNEATKNDSLLKAINSGKTDKFIFDNYIAPALHAQQKKYSETKQQSFADNLAKSITLNSGGFKDSNIVEGLKMIRKNDKEIAIYLAKELKGVGYNPRKW